MQKQYNKDFVHLPLSILLKQKCEAIAKENGISWTEFARFCIIEKLREYHDTHEDHTKKDIYQVGCPQCEDRYKPYQEGD